MKQMLLRKFAIATSTIAVAALFSVGWSERGGLSLSVESAQARVRLHVYRSYFGPYRADLSGVPWYAVRAYYMGGPWCAVGATGAGYGYGTAGGPWGSPWTCYSGWPDYKARNGIGCDPGTIVKGGDGIDYVCQ
jgi:hypothetical protein